MSLEADVNACCDNGNSFQNKLADTLRGLLNANNERKSEIDSLRNDHEELKKNHEGFVVSAERENDLRKNEIKSLEERMMKENQVSIVYNFVILNRLALKSSIFVVSFLLFL